MHCHRNFDEPLVWYEGSGTTDRRWLHTDERGSVVAVTNGSGVATNINAYDEYGIPASTNLGRFQYTGQAWLPELGMYYYKARMYSPALGRFMQTDPIGYRDGINWYNYVSSDPVNLTDPSGMAVYSYESDITVTAQRTKQGRPSGAISGGFGAFGGPNEPSFDISDIVVNGKVGQTPSVAGSVSGAGSTASMPIEQDLIVVVGKRLLSRVVGGAVGLLVQNIGGYPTAADDYPPQSPIIDFNQTVKDRVKGRLGYIKNVKLPKGSPSFDDIQDKKLGEIYKSAQSRITGYQTWWKLLSSGRFGK